MNEKKRDNDKSNNIEKINTLISDAKNAQKKILKLNTQQKNSILSEMAERIDKKRDEIIKANNLDIENNKNDLNKYMIDRLTLTDKRIDNMVDSIKEIIKQDDQAGRILEEKKITKGLKLVKKQEGIGVVAVIFESRPNVVSDVIGLCLKSSCTSILKCGKEAVNSCIKIIEIMRWCCDIENAFQLISDRDLVKPLLQSYNDIDLVIPRGGQELIDFVKSNTRIPVLHAGKGNCHIYVDSSANLKSAVKIIINAKTQRPTVCNAAEKVIVNQDIADKFLPELKKALDEKSVRIIGDRKTREIIDCDPAGEKDWDTEYLALDIAIKVVEDIDSAIDHINKHSSNHSEAIISEDQENILRFMEEIDSACVYANASTRFTDGYLFGMGAEIGISTQKLHARGPMGLKALTTTKYNIFGEGQIRD